MKITDATTGNAIKFNKQDKVVCIGCTINDELTKKAFDQSGAVNVLYVPSLYNYIEGHKDKSTEELLDYDYHIVIGSLDPSPLDFFDFCTESGKIKDSEFDDNHVINKDDIRLSGLFDAILFQIKDRRVILGKRIKFSPSLIELLHTH